MSDSTIPLGKSVDEIQIGDKASFRKTITETDVALEACQTGDFNPLHMDEEYAKTTRFGGRIAHGTVALGLLGPVMGMKLPGMGTILLGINVRYLAPVMIGDTVTAEAEVVEKDTEKNVIGMKVRFFNQNGVDVIAGEASCKPPRKKK